MIVADLGDVYVTTMLNKDTLIVLCSCTLYACFSGSR